MNGIYTDLAAELRELNPDIEGVGEEKEERDGITISRVGIITQQAAEKLGKGIGSYVTIDARDLSKRLPELFITVPELLGAELKKLLRFDLNRGPVLIIGLGNRSVTADSLGPRVVEKVYVTRHLKNYCPNALSETLPAVCAVAPGVLGITGVETLDIV